MFCVIFIARNNFKYCINLVPIVMYYNAWALQRYKHLKSVKISVKNAEVSKLNLRKSVCGAARGPYDHLPQKSSGYATAY